MDFTEKPKIALVTFTDDRDEGLTSSAIDKYMISKQKELKEFLESNDIKVIEPLEIMQSSDRPWYGLRTNQDIRIANDIIQSNNIDGAIIGSWNWAPPMLVIEFVRKINKPVLFFTENNPVYGGLVGLLASTSSLIEWGINKHAIHHERILSDKDRIIPWVKAVSAVSKLRESAALLWGGTYSLKMEHLQDDIPKLKTFFIRDILTEDQYVLVNKADYILNNQKNRVKNFLEWLTNNNAKITYDKKMCTMQALEKQTALLLAARDRLEELESENIGGISIKCQPEIYSIYGVNACTLPAFLPFPKNENGQQKVYSTVCEGDIKGLLTSMLLFAINPRVPPVFGDLLAVDDDHVEFANCGASSIFWSSNSLEESEAIRNLEIKGNCHGNSGAAFGYYGKATDKITVARLMRVKGKHYLQAGEGFAYDSRKFLADKLGGDLENHLGATWSKITVNLGVKSDNFIKVFGANHLSATLGHNYEALKFACRELGISITRIDNDQEMLEFYDSIRG